MLADTCTLKSLIHREQVLYLFPHLASFISLHVAINISQHKHFIYAYALLYIVWNMSFRLKASGKEFPNVFRYHWQHYSVAQLTRALNTAGFQQVYVYDAIEGEQTEVRQITTKSPKA